MNRCTMWTSTGAALRITDKAACAAQPRRTSTVAPSVVTDWSILISWVGLRGQPKSYSSRSSCVARRSVANLKKGGRHDALCDLDHHDCHRPPGCSDLAAAA